MSIYQRYLSKFLIFISFFFVIFLIFIESNIGFKWIVNFTSRCFINFTTEEVSGNWHNFTLKNIKYDTVNFSIAAKRIHIILDINSLFKRFMIFKNIETKELTISLKQNTSINIIKDSISLKNVKKNILIKYPIMLQKIYVDKILFKTSKVNLFFLNFSSGVVLVDNNIIFSSTHIDAINMDLKQINYQKKIAIKKLNFIKNINNTEKIYSLLYFFSQQPKIFIPFNIHLNSLTCKKFNFLHDKNYNFSYIELKAKIQNNILKIKKIKINSPYLTIQSFGKIFFNNNQSILCIIHSKVFIPKFHKKIFKFLFKANLNENFTFHLKSHNVYKINIYGRVFLDGLDYPFYMNFQSNNLLWSLKKHFILNINKIKLSVKGNINNYSLSLKHILTLQSMPAIYVNIQGSGNLQSIFIKKIQFYPIKARMVSKKIIDSEKNILNSQNILDLIGKINLIGESHNHQYNLLIPKMNLKGNLMQRKFSMTGSLCYRNFNLLEIPEINLSAGNNQFHLNGLLGEKYNVYSSINANNLEYFSSNLKGKMQAKINLRNDYKMPIINSKILASDLKWKNIFFKKIKILTKININHMSGKMLIRANKIDISDFYINSLCFRSYWNSYKQKFYFLLHSPFLNIHLILNGSVNEQTQYWYGFFEKININTVLGQVKIKNSPLLYYYDSNKDVHKFYKNNIKKRDQFNSLLNQTRTYFYNFFNDSLINFRSELFINTKFQTLMLAEKKYQTKMILIGNKIELEKKINGQNFVENIDYLKLSINLIKNTFHSKWIVKKIKNLSDNKKIIGYLDVIDIYHKKNIIGKIFIHDFPLSFVNFFTSSFKKIKGTFDTTINFFGTLYQPKVSADFNFQDVFIKSDNILQYITLFFPYFSGKVDTLKINQEIVMKQGNILFKSDLFFKNSEDIEWDLIFNSNKIIVYIFPQIKLKFSSQLNLHYVLSKYDLIGYIRFSWFNFNIYERNFIF